MVNRAPTSENIPGENTYLAHASVWYPRQVTFLCLAIAGAVILFFGVKLRDFAVDDAYITFRHAQNLAGGHGFSFNPGDKLLSTTSPLHALLLALFAWMGVNDLPRLAIWLSV